MHARCEADGISLMAVGSEQGSCRWLLKFQDELTTLRDERKLVLCRSLPRMHLFVSFVLFVVSATVADDVRLRDFDDVG